MKIFYSIRRQAKNLFAGTVSVETREERLYLKNSTFFKESDHSKTSLGENPLEATFCNKLLQSHFTELQSL